MEIIPLSMNDYSAPIADMLILRRARGIRALPITQIGNRSVPEALTQRITEIRLLSRLTPGLLAEDRLCDGAYARKALFHPILYSYIIFIIVPCNCAYSLHIFLSFFWNQACFSV